ncbi:hypothetical protein PG984_015317 [Apiospora sp. TS-2023a]
METTQLTACSFLCQINGGNSYLDLSLGMAAPSSSAIIQNGQNYHDVTGDSGEQQQQRYDGSSNLPNRRGSSEQGFLLGQVDLVAWPAQ